MKYNKQLFDQIETEYNQVLNLCEFIFDNLIEKNDEIKKYDNDINNYYNETKSYYRNYNNENNDVILDDYDI